MNQFCSALSRLLPAAGLFALTFLAQPASAQDPGSGGPQPGNPDPTEIPLDGGASLLLAGGAAYALNRLRKRREPAA